MPTARNILVLDKPGGRTITYVTRRNDNGDARRFVCDGNRANHSALQQLPTNTYPKKINKLSATKLQSQYFN